MTDWQRWQKDVPKHTKNERDDERKAQTPTQCQNWNGMRALLCCNGMIASRSCCISHGGAPLAFQYKSHVTPWWQTRNTQMPPCVNATPDRAQEIECSRVRFTPSP